MSLDHNPATLAAPEPFFVGEEQTDRNLVFLLDPLVGQGMRSDVEISIPGRTTYTGSPVGFKDPIAIQYIAAHLESKGFETLVMMKALMEDREILGRLSDVEDRLLAICIALHSTYMVPGALEFARNLKTSFPDIPLIVGGYHPTGDPEIALDPSIDFAILGEGEAACEELLRGLQNGATSDDFANMPGLAFRGSNGEMMVTPRGPRVEFSELPWPKREQEILDLCHPGPLSYPPVGNVAQIAYSRGCPYGCNFCASVGMWKRIVNYREPADVAAEMKHLITHHGVNNFFFCDLSFNGVKKKLLELCDHTEQLAVEVDVEFGCHVMCTSTIIDEEVLARMKAGRFWKIDYGLEDVLEGTISRIKTFQKISRIRTTLDQTNRYGILMRGLMMIGYPWETEETMNMREELIDQFLVDQLRLCFYTPYKGTPLYDEVKDRIIVEADGMTTDRPAIRCGGISSEKLMASVPRLLRRLYNSDNYAAHIAQKCGDFPELAPSYDHFFQYLHKKELTTAATSERLRLTTERSLLAIGA